jgi:hypothetical protein
MRKCSKKHGTMTSTLAGTAKTVSRERMAKAIGEGAAEVQVKAAPAAKTTVEMAARAVREATAATRVG